MANNNEIAVMFSGGTDSTYAAWTQMPDYNRIILISFIRHGLKNLQNPDEAVLRLKKSFPEKDIIYQQFDCENIYQQVTPHIKKQKIQMEVLSQKIGPLWEDRHGLLSGQQKYHKKKRQLFMANECLQCKIAMHLAAIKYCREHNIYNLCDGSNAEQLDDGSQIEDVKIIAQDIFKRYGINYFSPVFHSLPEERGRALYEAGIIDQLEHKRLEKTHQIPSRQIQCTVPSAALWTICVFKWLVYDGQSCNDYIAMCCDYYKNEMERGLRLLNIK